MPELKPLPCPAWACQGSLVECKQDGESFFIVCKECGMRGPVEPDPYHAQQSWDWIPRVLTWTTEPPKETGFYWWKCDGHIKTGPQVVYVKTGRFNLHPSGLEMMFIHHGPTYHHCDKCQWSGPIAPPRE